MIFKLRTIVLIIGASKKICNLFKLHFKNPEKQEKLVLLRSENSILDHSGIGCVRKIAYLICITLIEFYVNLSTVRFKKILKLFTTV